MATNANEKKEKQTLVAELLFNEIQSINCFQKLHSLLLL